MKKLFVLAVLCLSFSANATVNVRGSRSCGDWVNAHRTVPPALDGTFQETWLVGYLSGYAVASSTEIMGKTDNPSIFLWVTNYCNAHPLDQLYDAASDLVDELAKKNKK